MATIDDMMTSLANAVRSKAGVTGKLSITAMTNAVNSISVGSGSSVDLSGVTAEAQYVLSGQKFVNSSGTLVTGTAGDARTNYGRMEVTSMDVDRGEINLKPLSALMPNGTAIITPETTFFCSVSNILMGGTTITPTKATQTISSRGKLLTGDININPIPAEYITTTDADATAADIAKDKTAYVNGQKITGTLEAASGDSTVKFGYWNAEGKFQEIDLSGDSPVDIGDPVTVDAQMFATGKPAPEYPSSGGGGMSFYECASVAAGGASWSGYKMEWREAENATIGIRLEGWDSNFDGEYILLDNNAIGADRVLAYNGDTNSNKFIKFWEGMFWALVKSNGTSDSPEIESSIFNANASIDDIVQGLNGRGATFTKFEQGESAPSGWYKTDTPTEGLEVKGYYPVVGRIYNADTTVWARDLFVQQEGKMVLLVGFEKRGQAFMDETDTCFCNIDGTSRVSFPFNNIPKLFGDYACALAGTYPNGLKTYGFPELDEFTVEFYAAYYSDFNVGGYYLIDMPQEGDKVRATLSVTQDTTESKLPKHVWHHFAYVRRKGTGVVTEYVNGVKRMDIPFDKPIGGRLTVFASGSTVYTDQYTVFNYAKYTSDFTPDYKEYLPIVSGLNQFDYPTREVGVSGCSCRFVNNKSYALVDSTATGTNRVWSSSDGKYYIRYEYETWYLTDSLSSSGTSITYARCACPMDEETWMPLDIDPIGYPDWKDNFTQQSISVVYNS